MRKVGADVSPLLITIIGSAFSAVDGLAFQLFNGDTFDLPACYFDRVMVFAAGLGTCLVRLLIIEGLHLRSLALGQRYVIFTLLLHISFKFFSSIMSLI
jgi:hypothetical protein